MRFLKATLLNLVATGIGLGVTFALLEFVLACTLPPPLVYRYPQPLHRADAQLGWTMVPNQHTFTLDKPVVTNSLGFRSPELSPQKDSRALRVMCLGDSQTFGYGVSQDETYPARLGALLARDRGDRPVEFVNAGVQVYSTEQEVDQLERFAPPLQPDVVTLGFYLNDLDEVLAEDKASRMDESSGEFAKGGLQRYVPSWILYGIRRSRLVTFIHWRWGLLTSGGDASSETRVLLGTPPPKYERGWTIVEAALVRARSFCAAHGIRFIVFAVPHPQEFAQPYPHEQYRSRFLDLAHRLGIETIDPAPSIRASGPGVGRFFITWDGHLSSEADALIAELLAREIAGPIPARPWPPTPEKGESHGAP